VSADPPDPDAGRVTDHPPGGAPVTPFSTAGGGKPVDIVDPRDQTGSAGRNFVPPSTAGGGQPGDDGAPDTGDLAHDALADARRIARNPGNGRGRGKSRRTRQENLAGRTGGYSGPGPDPGRDPQLLGSLLAGYVEDRGWERPLAEARVFADWATLVGRDVAAHCTPQSLNAGELRITAESTAWATQLRLLSATLLARLVAELGPEVVSRLAITGPIGPSWKHGGRSVRGARGPRDTYG
jgi:predicted nucleic acid-binding Zn ribbon protein